MLPNNLQLEKELIWLCLYSKTAIPKIAALIQPSDFYHLLNKENYLAALASYKDKGFVDLKEIKKVYEYDNDYVSELWIPRLTKDLRTVSKERALVMLADRIPSLIKDGSEKTIETILGTITYITTATEKQKTDVKTIGQKVMDRWIATQNNDLVGLPCGFSEIDKAIGGVQPGHVWLIGGYTNYGKSTLAISFVSHLLEYGPILFCSLEMSQEQIFEKLISNITRETSAWNRRNCTDSKVIEAHKKVSESQLEITDTLYTTEAIEMKIREMIMQDKKPVGVFIDFIQNMQGEAKSEYERVTNNIIALQQIARSLGVCLFVLSQVNNQSTEFKSEVIGFKSSGALAAAADITIQIIRNKTKEIQDSLDSAGKIEYADFGLLIQKNRHGRAGYINLDFDITKGLIINH